MSAAQSGDPNAHRRKTPSDGETIGGIAVAYEMSGRTIPWEGLGNLARDPFRRRMVGDAQRDQASPFVPQDDQDKQQPKLIVGTTRKSIAPIPVT